jgi:hypothetical protein
MIKPTMIVRKRRIPGKGTLKTKLRPITSTFRSRGQTFIGHSTGSDRLLDQLYDTRSSVEHMKDIMPTVRRPRGISAKEAFEFRALQSEILASSIYTRVFCNPELMQCFSTERKVEGFWNRAQVKRMCLWGTPVDLDAEARSQFLSHVSSILY